MKMLVATANLKGRLAKLFLISSTLNAQKLLFLPNYLKNFSSYRKRLLISACFLYACTTHKREVNV